MSSEEPKEKKSKEKPTTAQCIRRVSNLVLAKNSFKFDFPEFDPEEYNKLMEDIAPKFKALLANIEAIDEANYKKYGHTFKHFIFSDIKPTQYGAKAVASALIANGFNLAYEYDNTKKQPVLFSPAKLEEMSKGAEGAGERKNVAVMTSSVLFNKTTINTKTKKAVLRAFNERPDNVYGERIRFIVMDSSFKEGIDLFDIRYVHILEPQSSLADQKQVIGRGTRLCGQQGLLFHPRKGWPLHVFVYDSVAKKGDLPAVFQKKLSSESDAADGSVSLHDLYMKFRTDVSAMVETMNELDDLIPQWAVDVDLTKPIHSFDLAKSVYPAPAPVMGGTRAEARALRCQADCKKTRRTVDLPVPTPLMALVYLILASKIDKEKSRDLWGKDYKYPRLTFCRLMHRNPKYCAELRKAIADPDAYMQKNKRKILEIYNENEYLIFKKKSLRAGVLRYLNAVVYPHLKEAEAKVGRTRVESDVSYVPPEKKEKGEKKEKKKATSFKEVEIPVLPTIPPPPKPATMEQMRDYVDEYFVNYTWPPVRLTNMCGGPTKVLGEREDEMNDRSDYNVSPERAMGGGGASEALTLSPTQEFVRRFFTPASPYKGLYLYHGVGVGKTCSAIATASTTFEREGYTILWVTRTSLKNDIWKNMFDKVCHEGLRYRLKDIPEEMESRMRMLGKAWSIRPMSYKQFTNLVEGKNEMYKSLVRKNGVADPLRKTLIIIDEAHKLYGNQSDMTVQERPNMKKFKEALDRSYRVSGADSARVMLMTATPMTASPMELVKLLNLLHEPSEQIRETEYADFAGAYLDGRGHLTEAGLKRMEAFMVGYISYLNRGKDARQFAQPILHSVPVPLSQPRLSKEMMARKKELEENEEKLAKVMKELEGKTLRDCKKDVNCIENIKGLQNRKKAYKEEIAGLKKHLKEKKKEAKKSAVANQLVALEKCLKE